MQGTISAGEDKDLIAKGLLKVQIKHRMYIETNGFQIIQKQMSTKQKTQQKVQGVGPAHGVEEGLETVVNQMTRAEWVANSGELRIRWRGQSWRPPQCRRS